MVKMGISILLLLMRAMGLLLMMKLLIFLCLYMIGLVVFLTALKVLETHNYLLINDVESFNTWIEIQKKKTMSF